MGGHFVKELSVDQKTRGQRNSGLESKESGPPTHGRKQRVSTTRGKDGKKRNETRRKTPKPESK